jgi:hypothetical protein
MSEFGPLPPLTSDCHLALRYYRGAATQNPWADPVLSAKTDAASSISNSGKNFDLSE